MSLPSPGTASKRSRMVLKDMRRQWIYRAWPGYVLKLCLSVQYWAIRYCLLTSSKIFDLHAGKQCNGLLTEIKSQMRSFANLSNEDL